MDANRLNCDRKLKYYHYLDWNCLCGRATGFSDNKEEQGEGKEFDKGQLFDFYGMVDLHNMQ